jgi:sigma-B regulation protein RsbU (phosphoserine phosphatase)
LLLSTLARVEVSVELTPTLQSLLDTLHELIPFDAGGIFVLENHGHGVRAQATRGLPVDLRLTDADGIVGAVIRSGTLRLVRDVAEERAYLKVRPETTSQLTVPLSSPRAVLGAISLEADRPAAFTEDDVGLVSLFAQHATIAIERALLHEHLLRQSRFDREIEIAREVLQRLTPDHPPATPGLQVAGRSLTAESVGGDAFDYVAYPDAQLGLSISDARGKGLPAALLMLAHQATLQALVSVELRLRATFTRISEMIARSMPPGSFVTTFYGILDLTERRMVYVDAGHPPPLLVHKDGSSEPLAVTGPALGFPHAAPMREAYALFGPGEGLVLFTDGVTETGRSTSEFLEVAGIQEAVRKLWSADVVGIRDGILGEVERRSGGGFSDDATVVVARFD